MTQKKLPEPKAVLFDWDNTLIDNWPTALHAINTVLKHYDLPLHDMESLKNRPARALRETFRAYSATNGNRLPKFTIKPTVPFT